MDRREDADAPQMHPTCCSYARHYYEGHTAASLQRPLERWRARAFVWLSRARIFHPRLCNLSEHFYHPVSDLRFALCATYCFPRTHPLQQLQLVRLPGKVVFAGTFQPADAMTSSTARLQTNHSAYTRAGSTCALLALPSPAPPSFLDGQRMKHPSQPSHNQVCHVSLARRSNVPAAF